MQMHCRPLFKLDLFAVMDGNAESSYISSRMFPAHFLRVMELDLSSLVQRV